MPSRKVIFSRWLNWYFKKYGGNQNLFQSANNLLSIAFSSFYQHCPTLKFSFFIIQTGPQWKYSFLALLHYPSHYNFYRLYFHFNCFKFVVGVTDLPTYLLSKEKFRSNCCSMTCKKQTDLEETLPELYNNIVRLAWLIQEYLFLVKK